LDAAHLIRLVRSVKSTYELDLIRQAAAFSDQVAAYVPQVLDEGMTELDLAGRVEAEARRLGHQGIVRMRLWGSELFYGHLMAGPSAAVPSYLASPTGGSGVGPAVAQGPGFRRIKRNEPVLVDYVFAHKGYIADHSRIFSIGSLSDKLVHAHEAMLSVQQTIKKAAEPGVVAGEIYAMALECAAELGYGDNFMGVGNERIRFVGHGIGLELDEYPFLAAGQQMKLAEGMTLAFEPKLIYPGQGVVGTENTHVVTEHGLEQLTHYREEIVVV
jgi:Xaa-Pro aminopeptidase